VEEVKKYLDQYTNDLVNKLEAQSRQPSLYFAALIADHNKSYEVMKMLIDHGANPNFKDQYIQTVFFYACREGKPLV
jgi:ankyrin repeat protein